MSANDKQIGGSHYKDVEGEMLWDRLIRIWGWPRAKLYFIGSAMKYLERHEKKGGLESLEKAAHFCEKIVEEERKYQASLPTQPGDLSGEKEVRPCEQPDASCQVTPDTWYEHEWTEGLMSRCLNCGLYKSLTTSLDLKRCLNSRPFDTMTESCCECGEDYSRRDLVAGHIFCPECRKYLDDKGYVRKYQDEGGPIPRPTHSKDTSPDSSQRNQEPYQ